MDRSNITERIHLTSFGSGVGPFSALDDANGESLSCYRIPDGTDLGNIRERLEVSLGNPHRSFCDCLGIHMIDGQLYVCENRPGTTLAETFQSPSGSSFGEAEIVWFLHALLTALSTIHQNTGEPHGNLDPSAIFASAPTNRKLMIGGAFFWRRLLDLQLPARHDQTVTPQDDIREALRLGVCLATKNWNASLDELQTDHPPLISSALWRTMATIQQDIVTGIKDLAKISRTVPLPVANFHPNRLNTKLAKHQVFNFQKIHIKKSSHPIFYWIKDDSCTEKENEVLANNKEALRLERERIEQLALELKAQSDQLDERESMVESKDRDHLQRSIENESKSQQLMAGEEYLKSRQAELETRSKRMQLDQEKHLKELSQFEGQRETSIRKEKETEANVLRITKQIEEFNAAQNSFRLERENWQQRVLTSEAESKLLKLKIDEEAQKLHAQSLELTKKDNELASQRKQLDEKSKALQILTQDGERETRKRSDEFSRRELEIAKAQKELQSSQELKELNRSLNDQLVKTQDLLQRGKVNIDENTALAKRVELLSAQIDSAKKETLRHLQTIAEKDRDIAILKNQSRQEQSNSAENQVRLDKNDSAQMREAQRQAESLRERAEASASQLQLVQAQNRELKDKISKFELELRRLPAEIERTENLQSKIVLLEKQAAEFSQTMVFPAETKIKELQEQILLLEKERQISPTKSVHSASSSRKSGTIEPKLLAPEKENQKTQSRVTPVQPSRSGFAYLMGASIAIVLAFSALLGLRILRLQRELATRPATSTAGSVVVIASPRAELLIDGLEPQSTPAVLRDLAPGTIQGKLRTPGKEDKTVEIKVPNTGVAVAEYIW